MHHRPWLVPGVILGAVVASILAPVSSVRASGADPTASAAVADVALSPRRAPLENADPRAPIRLELAGRPVTLRVQAFTLLPEEGVVVRVDDPRGAELHYQAGDMTPAGEGRWRWTAPSRPGIYALQAVQGADTVDLTALVLHPASAVRDGTLNGYRIGRYQPQPLRGDPAYLPPEGFVEVTRTDRDILVSPHFKLGQFLCKQPGEPRYIAISPPLLAKLESVTGVLRDHGISPGALRVMSGFRTPAYNAAIGNTTVYSRHLWGDAADVYVDADGDGSMDDLNGDGRYTVADARVLASWIEGLHVREDWRPGGLAAYRANAAHGPFVHVDARGSRARW